MVIITKINCSVYDARQKENMIADMEKYKSYVDYIAMMNDVSLPQESVDERYMRNDRKDYGLF